MITKHIAIFASGNGSNAENIIRYFQAHPDEGAVSVVVCNRKEAKVLERAKSLGVRCCVISKSDLNSHEVLSRILDSHSVDMIILAGFLLMIPSFLIESYKERILNIHPSLLPAYGGKGMYGHFIHEAVVANGEEETGITIHRVSEKCDEGEIIFQTKIKVEKGDTPESVESKIHLLEKEHYPRIISKELSRL